MLHPIDFLIKSWKLGKCLFTIRSNIVLGVMDFQKQGAEAKVYVTTFLDKKCLVKERFKKLYRHPELEKSLTTQRLKNEVRALVKCRQCGKL